MSVQTGISPRELLQLDGELFEELVAAVDERWSLELELAASTLEVAHAHFLAYVRAHAQKNVRLPDPLVVERPKRDDSDSRAHAPRVSVNELAQLSGQTIIPAATPEPARGR